MTTNESLDDLQKKELNIAKLKIERFLKLAAVKVEVERRTLNSDGNIEVSSDMEHVIEDAEPILLLDINPLNQPALDGEMLRLFGHQSWPDSKHLQSNEENEVRNVYQLPIVDGRKAFFQRTTFFEGQPLPGSVDRRRVSRITYSAMAVPSAMEEAVSMESVPPDVEALQSLSNIHLIESQYRAQARANTGTVNKETISANHLPKEMDGEPVEHTFDVVELHSGLEVRILGNAALLGLDTEQ